MHVVPAVTIGGLWRHLQVAVNMKRHQAMILSIFDMDHPPALSSLSPSVIQLKNPLESFRSVDSISQQVERQLCHFRPDVVHSHHYYADIYAVPAAYKTRIPVLRSVHGISQASPEDPFDRTQILYDWSASGIGTELGLDPFVKLTITVSQELRRKLLGYGFPSEKVITIYSGVDVELLSKQRLSDSVGHTLVSQLTNTTVIGFAGRLEPVKNPLSIAPLAHRLLEAGSNVKFVVIGEGSLRHQLLNMILQYGLTNRVIILPMSVEIYHVLDLFNVLVIPSRCEGVPLVMLEAMALGKPIVAANVGGIPEVLQEGVNGYLVNPDDIDTMANRIKALVESMDLRMRLGTASQLTISRKFTLRKHIQRLEQAYRKCLQSASAV